MNCYDYRHRAVALWFLSSISLDGNCDVPRSNRCSWGRTGQEFVATAYEDDDECRSDLEFPPQKQTSLASRKSDFCTSRSQMSKNVPILKNVCFGELSGGFLQQYDESQRSASSPRNQNYSIPVTSGHEHFTHSVYESLWFAISTVSQRKPPIVVASVIPLSRDPLMQSGIPKGQSGTQIGGTTSGGNAGRQRSVPEMPTALFNTFFRHNASASATVNALLNGCPRSGSLEDNLPPVKPLSHSKPVDSVERSYAHFLVPRNSLRQNPNVSSTNRQGGSRRRAETVVGDGIPEYGTAYTVSPTATTGKSSGGAGQYRSRSHTLSFSSMTSAISRLEKSSSPLQDTSDVWGLRSVEPIAYLSSPEKMEPLQAVIYEDPLISYDPLLLDDPMISRITNRRVFPFQGYVASILGYRRAEEYKKSINQEFHQRFPNIQLTLTKMRSIKLNLLAIILRMNLDLWIVVHAYVLFEKMILKLLVCKANRKLCAGAALLISAKLNDLKGPIMPVFFQEIETEFRISHRDLIHMEMAAFIGLEFCVLPSPAEALPHFTQIQKSLGIVVAAPRCISIPTRSRSLEDDNSHSSPAE